MPSLQNVTINDRATPTPVAHVFTPRDVNAGVGLVVSNTGVPLAEERLTVSNRKSGSKFKGKATLVIPTVSTAVINGISVPTIVRTAYINVETSFDESSTLQERTNAVGMMANALGVSVTLVHKALVELEGVYGS